MGKGWKEEWGERSKLTVKS